MRRALWVRGALACQGAQSLWETSVVTNRGTSVAGRMEGRGWACTGRAKHRSDSGLGASVWGGPSLGPWCPCRGSGTGPVGRQMSGAGAWSCSGRGKGQDTSVGRELGQSMGGRCVGVGKQLWARLSPLELDRRAAQPLLAPQPRRRHSQHGTVPLAQAWSLCSVDGSCSLE